MIMNRDDQAELYSNLLRGTTAPVTAPAPAPVAAPTATPLATQLRAPGTTDWDKLLYQGYAGGMSGGGDNGTPMTEQYSAIRDPNGYLGYEGTAGKYSNILMNNFSGYDVPQYIPGMVYGTGDNGDGSMMGEVLNPEWSQEAYDAAKAEYMKNPTFTAERIKSGAGDDNAYQTAQMKIVTDPDGKQYLVPEGGWTDIKKQSGWSDDLENESLWKFLAVVGAGVGGAALGLGGAGAGGAEMVNGAFLGEGMASGIPAWDAAATAAGLPLVTPTLPLNTVGPPELVGPPEPGPLDPLPPYKPTDIPPLVDPAVELDPLAPPVDTTPPPMLPGSPTPPGTDYLKEALKLAEKLLGNGGGTSMPTRPLGSGGDNDSSKMSMMLRGSPGGVLADPNYRKG